MRRWLRRIALGVGILFAVAVCAYAVLYVWSERVLDRRHPVPTVALTIHRALLSSVGAKSL